MSLNRSTLFQLFKYIVYSLLALNVYLFWHEEYLAALVEYPNGLVLAQVIDAYATTIDTAAWLVLLLMFELETFVLDDSQVTRRITLTLHGVRFFAYVFIVYAFYGYAINVIDTYDVTSVTGVADLCAMAGDGYSYAIDYDEYVGITTQNCGSLSEDSSFFRFADLAAVVDAAGLSHIRLLALADAINSLVWILIVVILEFEVRLQDGERLTDTAVKVFGGIKLLLYSVLLLLAVYWGFEGDFVDFWDAFLWLVAFFFIELNVIEWRQDDEANEEAAPLASA